MKRNSRMRGIGGLLALALGLSLLMSGCGAKAPESGAASSEAAKEETSAGTTEHQGTATAALPDGVYTARFETDSSMFHVSEAMHDRGTLTVKDGKMTLHVSLQSKRILNLFPGRAEDAKKDGAALLQPTTDTVKFEDGSTRRYTGSISPFRRSTRNSRSPSSAPRVSGTTIRSKSQKSKQKRQVRRQLRRFRGCALLNGWTFATQRPLTFTSMRRISR